MHSDLCEQLDTWGDTKRDYLSKKEDISSLEEAEVCVCVCMCLSHALKTNNILLLLARGFLPSLTLPWARFVIASPALLPPSFLPLLCCSAPSEQS